MIRLSPIFIAVLAGLVIYFFSRARMQSMLNKRSQLLRDAPINRLIANMAEALDLPKINVYLFDHPMINGLATADGRVFITKGLYDKYRAGEFSADEIASVIAHELGHLANGHMKRRLLDFSVQNALRVTLLMMIGRWIPFIGIYLVNLLVSAIAAKLSRHDEFEADAYASALMAKIGVGLHPQISMFEKLDALMANRMNPPEWMMSHPKTTDRIAAIKALEAKWYG